MLRNHRRALAYALGLFASVALVFFGVGRHRAAPQTTVPFIGEWDRIVWEAAGDITSEPVTFVARALSVVGGGLVTIPLRIVVATWLAFRTRWRALVVWLVTWGVAEVLLAGSKAFFARGRPPDELVETVGYSFPSGHAVAAAATGVALVLVLMPAGPERRRWEWTAAAFAFVMALSRVYLHAHWFSDVVAGVLLGTGAAVGVAAGVTEVRDRVRARTLPRRGETDPVRGAA